MKNDVKIPTECRKAFIITPISSNIGTRGDGVITVATAGAGPGFEGIGSVITD